MKNRPALTLVELMLVMVMLLVVGVPAILSVNVYRQKQALVASVDNLVSVLSQAHIYAREAKEQKQWGVRYKDQTSYQMISGSPVNPAQVRTAAEYGLITPTRFLDSYTDIWFLVDTGETETARNITLRNTRGDEKTVVVNRSGVIEVQ